jgi:uncharacterized protein (DUF58 family)
MTDAPPRFSELLPSEIINMIGRLEFLARTAKVGSINGRHTSPHKGFSVEFAEHRQYVTGDDLRNLDWRVYGKSDRYYIKQYIEETNMRVTLLVDASGSMAYEGEAACSLGGKEHLSKFEYARYLASALGYLLIRQQDAVGLVTFDEAIRTYLRPAAKPSQVRTVLEELARTVPGKDTRCAATFHEIAERIPSRGLVIDDFRCLEIEGRRLNIDPSTIRASYLERVKTHLKSIELTCGQMQADYVPVNTKTPVPEALFTYFSQRKA